MVGHLLNDHIGRVARGPLSQSGLSAVWLGHCENRKPSLTPAKLPNNSLCEKRPCWGRVGLPPARGLGGLAIVMAVMFTTPPGELN